MPQEFKRLPAVEKDIKELTDRDVRVRLTGLVIDSQGQSVVLDDGTGRIKASFNQPIEPKLQKAARVIGRVMALDGGLEIQGEIFQDMEKLDIDVFKKLRSIKRSDAAPG